MKNIVVMLLALSLCTACGHPDHQPGAIAANAEPQLLVKPQYLMGYWQNVKDKDDYICLSYEARGLTTGKGFWGTFPLAVNPKNMSEIDTAKYNAHPSYAGSFQIKATEIVCHYNTANSTKYSPDGKITLLKNNQISLPTGTYKKLSAQEIHAINPNM